MSNDLILSLRSHGKSVSVLAKNLQVCRQSVYDALNGGGVRRVRVHIAQIIGQPPSAIFPKSTDKSKRQRLIDDADFYRLKNSENSGASA
jgi:lambda repressor-like predicted transcriptional regulator